MRQGIDDLQTGVPISKLMMTALQEKDMRYKFHNISAHCLLMCVRVYLSEEFSLSSNDRIDIAYNRKVDWESVSSQKQDFKNLFSYLIL